MSYNALKFFVVITEWYLFIVGPWSEKWPYWWYQVVSGVMNINSDPGCGRTMDPNMPLSVAQAQMSSWPQVVTQVIQVGMTL